MIGHYLSHQWADGLGRRGYSAGPTRRPRRSLHRHRKSLKTLPALHRSVGAVHCRVAITRQMSATAAKPKACSDCAKRHEPNVASADALRESPDTSEERVCELRCQMGSPAESRRTMDLVARNVRWLAVGAWWAILWNADASAATGTVSVGNAVATVSAPNQSVPITFPLTRTGDLSSPLLVTYQTQDGTAIEGTDYLGESRGFRIFDANESATTTLETVLGGPAPQPDKQFYLQLKTTAALPTFNGVVTFPAGRGPETVGSGDLNGDGRVDLVVADSLPDGYAVSYLLNATLPGATSVSFAAPVQLDSGGTALNPYAVITADLNGDGKPDVIAAGGGEVWYWINSTPSGAASPTFYPISIIVVTGLGQAQSVAVADINGDGIPDLVVASTDVQPDPASGLRYSGVAVLLGTSTPGATIPSFASPAIFTAGQNCAGLIAISVRAGDLNGDGLPDLVTNNICDGNLQVLLNTTQVGAKVPSFAPAVTIPVGNQPLDVVMGDLNGDGLPDLAAANYGDNTISILVNTTPPGASIPTFVTDTSLLAYGRITSLNLADFNGDGRLDLAVANYGSNSVSVDINATVSGSMHTQFLEGVATGAVNVPVADSYFVTSADLNSDGAADLIIGNSNSDSVSVALNSNVFSRATLATAVGTGTIQYQAAVNTISPSSLDFGVVVVGATAPAQAVNIRNDGNIPLIIASVTVTGDFAQQNSCAVPVAPGAGCTIMVTFMPTVAGARAGTLTVLSNTTSGMDQVALSGSGSGPLLVINPTSLLFSPIAVGTSASLIITVSNGGTATLNLTDISTTGAFSETNNCMTALAPNSSCSITATFTPTIQGTVQGALVITSNSVGSPLSVSLTGAGTASGGTTASSGGGGALDPTCLAFLLLAAALRLYGLKRSH